MSQQDRRAENQNHAKKEASEEYKRRLKHDPFGISKELDDYFRYLKREFKDSRDELRRLQRQLSDSEDKRDYWGNLYSFTNILFITTLLLLASIAFVAYALISKTNQMDFFLLILSIAIIVLSLLVLVFRIKFRKFLRI